MGFRESRKRFLNKDKTKWEQDTIIFNVIQAKFTRNKLKIKEVSFNKSGRISSKSSGEFGKGYNFDFSKRNFKMSPLIKNVDFKNGIIKPLENCFLKITITQTIEKTKFGDRIIRNMINKVDISIQRKKLAYIEGQLTTINK